MSTYTAQAIEFRCTKCWQPMAAELEREGATVACPECRTQVVVPEATPDRLRTHSASPRASARVAESNPYAPTAGASEQMSDAELMKFVENENRLLPTGQLDFGGFPNASLAARFLANIIDSFYMLAAVGFGIVAVVAAAQIGLVERLDAKAQFDPTALILFSFFPIVGTIIQWNLIVTRGQTIGKLLTCIRMITMDGRLPGFLHGVVLRNWVRVLLGAIVPFFGIVDVLFIFGDAKRCLHDYISGTRVVQS